jgi:peptide/nickel transport system substrate-binding protein
VFLNVRLPPFDNRAARQALAYAVDRGAAAAKDGAARPTCQVVPPTTTGYRPYCPYTVDPNPQGRWSAPDLPTARHLVAASHTRGESVVLWTIRDFAAEAAVVVEALDQLGYRASLHEVTAADDYFDVGVPPTVQAGMYGWFGSQRASDTFETLTCGFDPNPAHFCDPNLDHKIAQLAQTEPTDPAGTIGLAASIDRALTSSAPWVPLLNPESVAVASPRVGNYQALSGGVLIDQLWVA